ncbi:MAG TPA: DNA-binding protein [Acetobacteraceae bacterium]|nr:DNA-binding protein [Acetobacteraceae bacterium]
MSTPTPKYAPIEPDWCTISGLSRRTTYAELGRGNLKAIKVGARTLIDVEAGLAWLRSLPAAQIKAPRQRQRAAA